MPAEFEITLELNVLGEDVKISGTSDDKVFALGLSFEHRDPPTLGEVVEYLLRLVVPEFILSLSPPWDGLADLTIPDLKLLVGDGIGFESDLAIHVPPFLELDKVRIWKHDEVQVELYGTFFGKKFDKDPVTWDALKVPGPVPENAGQKGPMFKLEYLALGQRVALREPKNSVAGIIDALTKQPPQQTIDASGPLKFQASAGWLFGLRMQAMDTLFLEVVFNDPDVYGIRLRLAGDSKAAGLDFEILYRKVAENLGVYHTDLTLPDVLRQLDVGAASITLPIMALDIYTDGSFLIDLGFPHDLDFSRSGSVEMLPFVGVGGLYLGVFAEGVPSLVPTVRNGTFSPVVACGLGLQIGVGKTIRKGLLKAGLTVGVVGILEGVVARFQSDDEAITETYFRVRGQIAVVGHLFGEVDFSIIRATVDVFAYASASFEFESFEPAIIVLEAAVSISLKVRITLITLEFRFEAQIREQFVIGHREQAPWIEGSRDAALPMRSVKRRRAVALPEPAARFELEGIDHAEPKERVSLNVYFIPQITVGLNSDDPDAEVEKPMPQVQMVAMTFIDAPKIDDNDPTDSPAPENEAKSDTSFDRLVNVLFNWAIECVQNQHPAPDQSVVDREQLAGILDQLSDPKDGVTFDMIWQLINSNFEFLRPAAPSEEELKNMNATFFPIIPELLFRVKTKGKRVVYRSQNNQRKCSDEYRQFIRGYFDQLALQIEREDEQEQARDKRRSVAKPSDLMAELILVDYCRLLLRHILSDALNHFDLYRLRSPKDETLESLATQFGADAVGQMQLVSRSDVSDDAGNYNQDEKEEEVEEEVATIRIDGFRKGTTPCVETQEGETLESLLSQRAPGVEPASLVEAMKSQHDLLTFGFNVRYTFSMPPQSADDDAEASEWVANYVVGNDETLISVRDGLVEDVVSELVKVRLVNEDVRQQLRENLRKQVDFVELLRESAGLLRPGAFLSLPGFNLAISHGDTLASLAERFVPELRQREAIEDLLAANLDWQVRAIKGIIEIPDCHQLPVEGLRENIVAETPSKAAGAVNRFFLHGLRLPDPLAPLPDNESLDLAEIPAYPLYRLSSQQWTVLDDALDADPLDEDSDALENYTFEFSTDGTNWSEKNVPLEEQGSVGRGFKGLIPDRLPHKDSADVQSVRAYSDIRRRYSLGPAVRWVNNATGEGSGIVRTIHPLPVPLRRQIRQSLERPEGAELHLRVLGGSTTDKQPDREELGWATRLDFEIRRISNPNRRGEFEPNLFELYSTDQTGRFDLLSLLNSKDAGLQLQFAYPLPGSDTSLVSDPVSLDKITLLQVNLSTFTRPETPGPAKRAAKRPEPEYHATADQTLAFLKLLWKASVINDGGFYLYYPSTSPSEDVGFAQSFGDEATARLTMIAKDTSASVQNFHNCFIVDEAGSPAGADNLYVELQQNSDDDKLEDDDSNDDELLAVWTDRRAALAPGHVGFQLTRHAPDETSTDFADVLTRLYHLVAFRVRENDDFGQSAEGAPLGPVSAKKATTKKPAAKQADPKSGADDSAPAPEDKWHYQRVLSIAALAKHGSVPVNDLPGCQSLHDPYSGVGGNVSVSITYQDIYGNRCSTQPVSEFALPVRFSDPVIPVHQWPAVTTSYDVASEAQNSQLELRSEFSPAFYQRPLKGSFAALRQKILDDRKLYEKIFFQIARPDVTFRCATSLDPSQGVSLPQDDFVQFVKTAYGVLCSLRPRKERVSSKDSFDSLSARFHVSIAHLAENNELRANLFQPGVNLAVLQSAHTVCEGETLRSIADHHEVSVAELAEWNSEEEFFAGRFDTDKEIDIPWHFTLTHAPELIDGRTIIHEVRQDQTLRSVEKELNVALDALVAANLLIDGLFANSGEFKNHNLATLLDDNDHLDIADLALRRGACLLVPPPPLKLSVAIKPDLQEQMIVPLTVEVEIERPARHVHPEFAEEVNVVRGVSRVGPAIDAASSGNSEPADVHKKPADLGAFAERFENAFPGLKLAQGPAPESYPNAEASDHLLVVQFQNEQFSFTFDPVASFFAVPPVSNRLWSDAEYTGVDLDVWNREFLETVDRILAPHVASRIYPMEVPADQVAENPDENQPDNTPVRLFQRIVAAKNGLAETISDSVIEVVNSVDRRTTVDKQAASEIVKQLLSEQLANVYHLDTMVQFGARVKSPIRIQHPPRLYGRAIVVPHQIRQGATLRSLALDYRVPVELLAMVIGAASGLLNARRVMLPARTDPDPKGSDFVAGPTSLTVEQEDTLHILADRGGMTIEQLSRLLQDEPGLLRVGADVPFVRREWTAAEGDTLRQILAILVPETATAADEQWLSHFAMANASVVDVFRLGAKEVRGKTLLQFATHTNFNAEDPAAALGSLVSERFDELVRPGVTLGVLVPAPVLTLSEAKLPLVNTAIGKQDNCASLTFSCSVPTAESQRFVTADLAFEVQALEYDVQPAVDSEYTSSRWLSFVRPPEPISLGSVDIPLPLRSHPATPVVYSESIQQAQRVDISNPHLVDLKKYDYSMEFSADLAAQDELSVAIEFNRPDGNGDTSRSIAGLAAVLAEFAKAVDMRKAVEDLNQCRGDQDNSINQIALFVKIADKIAKEATGAWQSQNRTSNAYGGKNKLLSTKHRYRLAPPHHEADIRANFAVSRSAAERRIEAKVSRRLRTFEREARHVPPDHQRCNFTMEKLDATSEQNVWGGVIVTRNERLLPNLTTCDRFVYESPFTGTPNGARPSLKHDARIDLSTLRPVHGYESPTLVNRLHALFTWLAGTGDLRVQVSTQVEIALTHSTDRTSTLTAATPGHFGVLQQLNFAYCEMLAKELLDWANSEHFLDRDGGWILAVRLFPPGVDHLSAPLIELTNLWLPFTAVAIPDDNGEE